MSLLDSLLLEDYRDPREVWIALRSDGARGTGTLNDPYDGGTGLASPISITNLVNNGLEATATTSASHGFLTGDVVSIAEVTGGGAAVWNGTFVILATGATTFTYTMAAEPSAAAGTITVARVIYRFDEVMRSVTENTAIHLGPGVFQTRGYDPGRAGQLNWAIRAGQRILGSGMAVTTLKLMFAVPYVPGVTLPLLTVAIGHGYYSAPSVANVDDFEVSDLTIDCNMRSQIAETIAKAAIVAHGKHVRIRRVRAVDFGTQSISECFVFTTAGADPRMSAGGADPTNPFTERVDCRIEDCVLEQPGLNGEYTITGLLLAAGERLDSGEMGWHRACVLRDNYINLEYQDRPASILSITIAAGVATVTTRTPHGRATDDYVVIAGALVNGSELNAFNGSYSITRIDDYSFTYVPVPYSELAMPTTNPTGDMWVGRFSSRYLRGTEITTIPSDPSPSNPTRRFKITLSRPHNRLPSNYVNVAGVKVGVEFDTRFNSRFALKAVPSPVELEFDVSEDIEEEVNFTAPGLIGSGHQAFSGEGGTEAVIEGNRAFHCWIGGSYHDTWSSKDLVMRNNHYHDVLTGPYQSFGLLISYTNEGIALKSLDHSGSTATAETFEPHGLSAGIDTVSISGASISLYDGPKIPVNGATSTTFAYTLVSNPGGPATGASYLIESRQKLIESLIRASDGTGYVVTAKTTYARHGFLKGDAVQIIKAGHFDLDEYPQSTLYNGSFTITDVPDEKTFCYRLSTDPGVDSSDADFAAGYFGRIWQSRVSIYEDNLIELANRFGEESTPFAIGLSHDGQPSRTNPYTFLQLAVRGNLVRAVDQRYGMVDSSFSSAIQFSSCEQALLDGNIIDLARPAPISFSKSGIVHTHRNQSMAGAPIRALNLDTNLRADDIATMLEDIQTLSLL